MLGLLLLAVAALAASSEAAKYFKDGKHAEKSGDMAQAYLLYSRAAALAPEKRAYWLKSQAVRSRAALQAKTTPAALPFDAELDSGLSGEPVPDKLVPVSEGDFREGRKPQPPKELKAGSGRHDFDLKGDAKQIGRAHV